MTISTLHPHSIESSAVLSYGSTQIRPVQSRQAPERPCKPVFWKHAGGVKSAVAVRAVGRTNSQRYRSTNSALCTEFATSTSSRVVPLHAARRRKSPRASEGLIAVPLASLSFASRRSLPLAQTDSLACRSLDLVCLSLEGRRGKVCAKRRDRGAECRAQCMLRLLMCCRIANNSRRLSYDATIPVRFCYDQCYDPDAQCRHNGDGPSRSVSLSG